MYRYRKTRVGSHYGPIGHVWMHCRTYFMSKTSFWLWKMPLLTVKNVHIISHRKRTIALVFKMSWETWNSLSNDKMGLNNFQGSSLKLCCHKWLGFQSFLIHCQCFPHKKCRESGPFIYYVITFLGFLDHPTPYVIMFLVLKIIKNWHFLTSPPPLQVIT